mmetsp:Transcript_20059/g.31386  ORF Transcript_20059/g.31386 Transcript_20059/m.31386 type:complete len:147 (-) Transcript_20059:136-576(-)
MGSDIGEYRNRVEMKRRMICAAAIPGDSFGEEVFVRGFGNFINIYQNLLVARVLLSWFPAAQGVGALQPLFNICDPYLNTFRGILPSLGGIDFSPILAFTLLQVSGSAMVSLGAELPDKKGAVAVPRPPRQVGPVERFVMNRMQKQ